MAQNHWCEFCWIGNEPTKNSPKGFPSGSNFLAMYGIGLPINTYWHRSHPILFVLQF